MPHTSPFPTPERVLLTGASGFVGAAVARVLLAQNIQLRLLVRSNSLRGNLNELTHSTNVSLVEGDLTNPRSLSAALAGCDGVFHVAADYRLWVPNATSMYAANVDGTVHLLEAAHAAGIKRMVYTSSVAVLGHQVDGQPADEETPSQLSDMIGHYKRSKFLAEAAVRELVKTKKIPVVIVNPSTPIGPRDVKPTPTGRMIIEAMHGRMPAYLNTGLNIVHVDDCAMGHWLAWQYGKVGERYILGGENLELRAILAELAQLTNRPAPTFELNPYWLWPVALGMEMAARLHLIKQPMLTTDTLRMAAHKMFFSAAKAQNALGFSARPASAALADAVQWFQRNSY